MLFAIPKVGHINCFTFVKHRVEAYLAVKVYIRIVQLYNLITGLDTGLLSRIALNNTGKLRTVIAYRADDNESKNKCHDKIKKRPREYNAYACPHGFVVKCPVIT